MTDRCSLIGAAGLLIGDSDTQLDTWIEELDRGTSCFLPKIGDERRVKVHAWLRRGIAGSQLLAPLL
jgi:hypothetical protein